MGSAQWFCYHPSHRPHGHLHPGLPTSHATATWKIWSNTYTGLRMAVAYLWWVVFSWHGCSSISMSRALLTIDMDTPSWASVPSFWVGVSLWLQQKWLCVTKALHLPDPSGMLGLVTGRHTVRKSGSHRGSPRGGGPVTAQLIPQRISTNYQTREWASLQMIPSRHPRGQQMLQRQLSLPKSTIRKQNKCHHCFKPLCFGLVCVIRTQLLEILILNTAQTDHHP